MPNKERNIGIDLLRIISMLMIVGLHVLNKGGILNNAEVNSPHYYVAWVLDAFCIGAVNCYALISGYVGVNSKIKYHKLAALWLQVVFWSVLFAMIFREYIPESKAFETQFNLFFPVYNRAYWYFTAYFVLFFFMPFINAMLGALSQKQLKALGWLIFIFFSAAQTLWQSDVMLTNRGYSVLWLTLLYILGGIIKKTELEKSVRPWLMLFGFFGFTLVSAGYKFAGDFWQWKVVRENLLSYISATTVAASVCLFLFCARLNIKARPFRAAVKVLAPHTFGVYLIHTNAFVFAYIVKDLFVDYLECPPLKMGALVLLSMLGIYLLCTGVEMLRSLLFRLLHIDQALASAENKIRNKSKQKA